MDKARIKMGVLGGIVGGMAMGMWMMFYYLATDRGFWSPVGYIGHFFLRDSDITAVPQVIVGLVVHMMMSMMLGAAIVSIFPPTNRALGMMRGVAVAVMVWVVMQYVVLNLWDQIAYEGIVDWAFAVGHVLFGAMLGLIAAPAREAERLDRVAAPT